MMRRVLVVDDDRDMVRTLSDVLRFAGWETVAAYSGEEATRVVAESSFTAVVMDVRMEGITGVDALRAMRALRPTIPVVLMTAYASTALLHEAETLGATRVLHKPVQIPGLLNLLDTILEMRRALLLVDDDPDFLRSLSAILRDNGYVVHEARSLKDAVAQIAQRLPGIVLLDLKLGNVEPREVIETIRVASGSAAIILCSGYVALLDEAAIVAPRARIIGCLQKPFAPHDLTEILDAAFG